ncbi:hypothetical protein D3C71_1896460 [compost metagenome]
MQRLMLTVHCNQLFGAIPMRREDYNAAGCPKILAKPLQETRIFIVFKGKERRTMCNKKCR